MFDSKPNIIIDNHKPTKMSFVSQCYRFCLTQGGGGSRLNLAAGFYSISIFSDYTFWGQNKNLKNPML